MDETTEKKLRAWADFMQTPFEEIQAEWNEATAPEREKALKGIDSFMAFRDVLHCRMTDYFLKRMEKDIAEGDMNAGKDRDAGSD